MEQTKRQTPTWIASAAEYERERAFVGRNWVKAAGALPWLTGAIYASAAVPLLKGAALAVSGPPAVAWALAHAQGWVWAGCLGVGALQLGRLVVMEAKHRRALGRAVESIDAGAGAQSALVAAANDKKLDDFARLVAIKALRREAKGELASAKENHGESEAQDARGRLDAIKRADALLDRRLDHQAKKAHRAQRLTPFSTEEAERKLAAPVPRDRPRRLEH